MDKNKLVSQIILTLENKAANLTKAALTAHEDATGEESKSEHKYDTRGLEASYLAEAQANMVAEIKKDIAVYKKLELRKFSSNSSIQLSAIVQLESEDAKHSFYFIAPNNGGLQLKCNNNFVVCITPSSPFGRKLLGLNIGDFVEIKTKNIHREYEVINIS